MLFLLKGLDIADQDDLKDRLHRKEEELNHEHMAKHNDSCCEQDSSDVIVDHDFDEAIPRNICLHS